MFFVCTTSGGFIYHRMTLKKFLTKEEVTAFRDGEVVQVETESTSPSSVTVNTVKHLGFNPEFEISKHKLQIDEFIGSGFYGEVFKGTFLLRQSESVAIKQPFKDGTKEAFKTMLSETKVLSYLGSHENVVRFIGAYTQEIDVGIILIITEYCENSSLESYLRNIKQSLFNGLLFLNGAEERPGYTQLQIPASTNDVDVHELIRFSKEIAAGMEYISNRKVIHSDLSTRNVLLNDSYTCKITDFGLSRKLYERMVYKKRGQEQMPFFWMSLESLKSQEFTTKSDVWSYAVTLWEIFTLGESPYPGMPLDVDFVNKLEAGLRMQKPIHANDKIYEKMLLCWDSDPDKRPCFSELKRFFEDLFNSFLE